MNLLDREAIIELLTQLGARLHSAGIEAEVYVVGGAAMTLAYNRRRATKDIDAVTEDQAVVEREARAMAAERRDLPDDWFNGRVRPLLPLVFDRGQIEVLAMPGLSVTAASPSHMIAMKVRAARSDADLNDLWLLCGQIGAQSIQQILSIADQVWGEGMVREGNRLLVTEFLRAKGLPDQPGPSVPGPHEDESHRSRCPGVTSEGTQCTRWVALGTTCWQH